jgi:hypothetical protein
MNRIAAALRVCRLVIGWAAMCYVAGAHAIPAIQSELHTDLLPLSDISAVARTPYQATRPVTSTAISNSDAKLDDHSDSKLEASAVEVINSGVAMNPAPCAISQEGTYSLTDSCNDDATRKSLSVQFGQRMGTDSNILGELDGLRVNFHLSNKLMLEGVAGYPVTSDQDKFNKAHQVYGLSANTGKLGDDWDLNSYFIEQQDNGEFLRNVGGALRYLRDKRSLLLLFNYDIANSSLDAFTASGVLRLLNSTSLSATVDVRNSPLCKRHQKYLQQTMAATDGWAWNPPTDRITHYTKELSEEVTTLTIGLTHTFSDRLKLTGSAAVLDVTRDAGTDSRADTPSEYFYHLRFSGSELMFLGNDHVLDLSHRITDTTRTSSATLNTHYAINSRWQVSPRLHTDYRDNFLNRSVERVAAPSVRMQYSWHDHYDIRIEAGGEWVSRELPDQASSDSSYYLNLGYKASY